MNELNIIDNLGPDFLDNAAMSRVLGISPRKLARLHAERKGPPRIMLGKKILYHRPSVLAWLVTQQQEEPPRRTSRRQRRESIPA